ncbi:MAG: trypsin-like serine protease [Cyanothece sp. SIO1E1]|nr:trypsin-like serine protease [Cyanothece sp. SIO1E1]
MNTRFLRSITLGTLSLAVTTGVVGLDTISPFHAVIPESRYFSLPPAWAEDIDEATNIRVYKRASPAVVSIDTEDANGSGSIISPDGLILTNAHVIGDARTATVTLADGQRLRADVIGFAENGLDLVALKIPNQDNLPFLSQAAPGSVQVGQRAFVIGNPFGRFQGSFTTGIVSRIDPERGLIQTDAAINPGNSGGPLLNSQGELIGVNTSIFTVGRSAGSIGIGFAIAIDQIQPFLVAVRNGRAPDSPTARTVLPFDQTNHITLDSTPVEGSLDQSSQTLPGDNSYFDAYTFEGNAGQEILVEMISDDLDAYLILLQPDGRDLAQDDDSGNESNARLVATLPVTGQYTILANTYNAGEAGRYRLKLAAAARSLAQPSNQALLQEIGELKIGGPALADGSLYREHAFQGRAGQNLTITLESDDFDPYLILISPSGKMLAQHDDISQNNLTAEINITLPQTGLYRVIANTYDQTGQGGYKVTVR